MRLNCSRLHVKQFTVDAVYTLKAYQIALFDIQCQHQELWTNSNLFGRYLLQVRVCMMMPILFSK